MLEILELPEEEASEKISVLNQDDILTLWQEFYSTRPLKKRNDYCVKCHNCTDCVRCYNCLNCIRCRYCAFCDGIIDGHFVVFNVQLTKAQWLKFVRNITKLSKEYKASIAD